MGFAHNEKRKRQIMEGIELWTTKNQNFGRKGKSEVIAIIGIGHHKTIGDEKNKTRIP